MSSLAAISVKGSEQLPVEERHKAIWVSGNKPAQAAVLSVDT